MRLRQKDSKFEASLGSVARHYHLSRKEWGKPSPQWQQHSGLAKVLSWPASLSFTHLLSGNHPGSLGLRGTGLSPLFPVLPSQLAWVSARGRVCHDWVSTRNLANSWSHPGVQGPSHRKLHSSPSLKMKWRPVFQPFAA